jgi:hypothetical protein
LPRARRLPLLLLLIAFAARHRSVQANPGVSVAAELAVGTGHDDNIFLSSDINAGPLRLGGWLIEAAPALELALAAAGYRLELAYDGDYRAADSVGHLYFQQLGLSLSPPELGRLRYQLGVMVGRFDTSAFEADRFRFGAGEIALRFALADAFRLLGTYHLERRSSPSSGDEDTLHLLDARLSYRPVSRLELAPRVSYLAIQAGDGADFRRLRAGLDVSVAWQRWTALARGWLGPLEAPSESAVYGGAQIEARFELRPDVDLHLSGEWGGVVSGDATGAYARRALIFGVVLHAATRPPIAPPVTRDELRPVVKVRQGVRFRFRAPRAASVILLGSWNDWATPGDRLGQTREPGLWETWLSLPPGTYRYHFLVDGEPVRPPDASRYAPDGFGGEDGVVDVGAEDSSDAVSSSDTASYVR